jgi:CHD5-like protein
MLPTHTVMLLTLDSHIGSEISASKSSFSLKFGTTLWILTTGLQFAIGWWFSRSAVFYLPAAWLGPFTWWLSLPFAPAGKSYHIDVMAPSDSRRVRLRELRHLADGLSTCHQSGRARGEGIHKSAFLLSFDTYCH